MAKFETVYCQELQTEISTEDYIDYIRNHTKPFTLLCPDEDCRHDCPDTRMKACAFPHTPNETYKVSPYFATYPKHKHSEHCDYTIVSQNVEEVIANQEQIRANLQANNQPIYNIIQEVSHDSSHFAYDEIVFNPQIPDYNSEIKQQIKANNCTSKTEIQRYCYTTPRRTNSLAKLIDKAKELADHKDLDKVFIKIPPDIPCTYNELFFDMNESKKLDNTLHIFWKKAIVYNFDDTFYISCYPAYYSGLLLPIIITVDPNTNTRNFMNDVRTRYNNREFYQENKTSYYIYILGTPTLGTFPTELSDKFAYLRPYNNSCITFTPFALNCMVIRDFEVKQEDEKEKS